MRIDKLLAANGIPRKEMKKALKESWVLVEDRPATSLAQNVDTRIQQVLYKGKRLHGAAHRYYMLNKPIGVVTANADPRFMTVFDCLTSSNTMQRKAKNLEDLNQVHGGETVSDRSQEKLGIETGGVIDPAGLYAIGRLDRDTSGLLIITDNGPLGFQLLHPDRHVTKSYEVCVNGPLDQSAVAAFAAGIVFRGGEVAKPAELEILTSGERESWARVTITEGKRHQVKKMFLAVGVKVVALKRLAFGDFVLDPALAEGDFRALNEEELKIVAKYLDLSREA